MSPYSAPESSSSPSSTYLVLLKKTVPLEQVVWKLALGKASLPVAWVEENDTTILMHDFYKNDSKVPELSIWIEVHK